jgi:hypothetical protein
MHFTAVHCMRHYTSSRSAGGRRFSTHDYITFVALAGRPWAAAPVTCACQRTNTLLFSDV